MKDWVKPYILQRTGEYVDDLVKDGSEKEQWLALKSKALEDEEIAYYELTSYLNCHFGSYMSDSQEFFYTVFGSVLADLPEQVFKDLCGMKNVFFTYNSKPGGEVKAFELEHDITQGNQQIVTFSYSSGSLPKMVLRGEIVHNLAHVYSDPGGVVEGEDQIDSIALEWGFEKELKAVKEHNREMESEKRRHPSVIKTRVIPSQTPGSPLLIMKGRTISEKTVYDIEPEVTSIGRSTDNDIVLKDPRVSRHHAEIRHEDDGYFLCDCASTNGTRVNGRKIQRKKLADVDVIGIGPFTLSFISKETS